jgi:hypothetical protein
MPMRPDSCIGYVTNTRTAWRFLSRETAIDISLRPSMPRKAFQKPSEISRDSSIASLSGNMTTRCRASGGRRHHRQWVQVHRGGKPVWFGTASAPNSACRFDHDWHFSPRISPP